jgi:O-antigen/teichoic acid export membrane protein
MSTFSLKNRLLNPSQLSNLVSGHLSLPLYRNGYALLFSGVISVVLGLVYWLVAARFYTPEIVGLNSAIIAAIMFLSGVAQLGFSSLLTYFIPRAGARSGALIGVAYAVSATGALLVSALFVWGINLWAPQLSVVVSTWTMKFAFVIAVVVMALFILQDSVLIGLRQPLWVPVENTLVAVAKVALLIGMVSVWQQYAVTAAWIVPALLALGPVSWYIVRRFLPNHQRTMQNAAVGFTLREIRSHGVGNYVGGILSLSTTKLMPVIVVQILGAEANAYFYIPWMITTGLQLIPQTMATSFTVEATHDGAKQAEYYRKVVGQCLWLLLPLIVLVSVGAPYILAFFGAEYVTNGTRLLSLLPLSLIPNLFVIMYLSMARLQNRMGTVMIVQGAVCFLMLGLSYLFMQWWGITGVGAAWLATQSVLAIVLYTPKIVRGLMN